MTVEQNLAGVRILKELGTVARLVPELTGVSDYEAALRRLTADSNEQLFTLVEASSLAYEADERAGPHPAAARAAAGAVKRTLLDYATASCVRTLTSCCLPSRWVRWLDR